VNYRYPSIIYKYSIFNSVRLHIPNISRNPHFMSEPPSGIKVLALSIISIWSLSHNHSSCVICASQVRCGLYSLEIMSGYWCRKASSADFLFFPWYDAADEHCSSLEIRHLPNVSISRVLRLNWWYKVWGNVDLKKFVKCRNE
jgi:hypothetical protein